MLHIHNINTNKNIHNQILFYVQANQLGKIDNPSSSGFFTPDTELGPFSLDQISAPDQRFNLGVGDTLHLEKSSSNQPLETR